MDRHRSPVRDDERGFTLIEVMVAAVILVVGLLGTVTMLDHAERSTGSTKAREGATALQREIVEAARAVPYDRVTPNGLATELQNDAGLTDSSPGSAGWTVRRRNITYTISVGACTVDDPRDGIGSHEAGVFCPGGSTTAAQCQALLGITGVVSTAVAAATAAATLSDCGIDADLDGRVDGMASAAASVCVGSTCGTADSNPADYKKVVALVRWDTGAGKRWALQATTIANPGMSAAPAVNALSTTTTLPITSAAVTSVPFTATTSIVPASFAWYLDGTAQGTATGSSTSWAFTWPLGTVNGGTRPNADEVLDGSYLVGARAFDDYGLPGAMRTVTVVLNRSVPYPPQQVAAGRSGSIVNLEWAPNTERDIAGYRAYRRQGTGSWTQACALTTATSCQDASPPAGAVDYRVVAVDKDAAGALREGTPSTTVSVPLLSLNSPPFAPTGLAASTSSGNTVLRWSAPAGGDPDPGDSIDHYNIYRDGTAFADRYDRTSTGSQLTYTDTRTGGTTHQYWVSAVDTRLAESSLIGPVTR